MLRYLAEHSPAFYSLLFAEPDTNRWYNKSHKNMAAVSQSARSKARNL